jgi:3-deoxy-D-manno-octulosonate 8-phosphate phosphatase (KDO 8-P phosphatase)
MNVLDRFQKIRLFVFDVDGVLTDGTVLLVENGLQARKMNVKDGLALQMAKKQGYKVIIVSGASSEPVINRFNYLGIDEVHVGIKDKQKFMQLYLQQNNHSWEETLFMGDDLPDLALLQNAGLACCPADAAQELHECCQYISHLKGGEGCVRDVIEKVLKLNGHWNFSTELTSR